MSVWSVVPAVPLISTITTCPDYRSNLRPKPLANISSSILVHVSSLTCCYIEKLRAWVSFERSVKAKKLRAKDSAQNEPWELISTIERLIETVKTAINFCIKAQKSLLSHRIEVLSLLDLDLIAWFKFLNYKTHRFRGNNFDFVRVEETT